MNKLMKKEEKDRIQKKTSEFNQTKKKNVTTQKKKYNKI